MKKNIFTSGFTLVELLVTIAVIGILAAIVYGNFNPAKGLARDDIRKADLKSLQLALALYKAQNGRYPDACGGLAEHASSTGPDWAGAGSTTKSWGVSCADYITGLVPNFIAELPRDPKELPDVGYFYSTDSNGTSYKIVANNSVETNTINSFDDDFARCPQAYPASTVCKTAPPANTYAVYSSGAESW